MHRLNNGLTFFLWDPSWCYKTRVSASSTKCQRPEAYKCRIQYAFIPQGSYPAIHDTTQQIETARRLGQEACQEGLSEQDRNRINGEIRDVVPKYLRPHLTARIADFLFIEDKDNASFDLEDGRVLNYQQMQELLAQTDEGLNEIERHLGPSRICLHQGADADNTRNFAQNFKNEACSSRRLED